MPGAKDVGVEFFTLSKSYNMPGWRVGFAVGNREMIAALARIKSYLDYGIFQPIQIAAIARAERPAGLRRRDPRDAIASGATSCATGSTAPAGTCPSPKATMFVWARDSRAVSSAMGSLEFSKFLLREAKVAVSPGIGFGEYGDHYVRFALIENEHRTRQAMRGIQTGARRDARRGRAAGHSAG